MPRRAALAASVAAVALLAASAGRADAQYRVGVPSRPLGQSGGGWYAGGSAPGFAPSRYAAPVYGTGHTPYYNTYRGGYGYNTGFYVPPVYQPFYRPVPSNYGYSNYGYGYRYGY